MWRSGVFSNKPASKSEDSSPLPVRHNRGISIIGTRQSGPADLEVQRQRVMQMQNATNVEKTKSAGADLRNAHSSSQKSASFHAGDSQGDRAPLASLPTSSIRIRNATDAGTGLGNRYGHRQPENQKSRQGLHISGSKSHFPPASALPSLNTSSSHVDKNKRSPRDAVTPTISARNRRRERRERKLATQGQLDSGNASPASSERGESPSARQSPSLGTSTAYSSNRSNRSNYMLRATHKMRQNDVVVGRVVRQENTYPPVRVNDMMVIDGKVWTACSNGTIGVFDATDGSLLNEYKENRGKFPLKMLCRVGKCIWAVSKEHLVVWDCKKPSVALANKRLESPVTNLIYLASRSIVLATAMDFYIREYDPKTFQCKAKSKIPLDVALIEKDAEKCTYAFCMCVVPGYAGGLARLAGQRNVESGGKEKEKEKEKHKRENGELNGVLNEIPARKDGGLSYDSVWLAVRHVIVRVHADTLALVDTPPTVMQEHDDLILDMKYHKGRVWTCSRDQTVRGWSVSQCAPLCCVMCETNLILNILPLNGYLWIADKAVVRLLSLDFVGGEAETQEERGGNDSIGQHELLVPSDPSASAASDLSNSESLTLTSEVDTGLEQEFYGSLRLSKSRKSTGLDTHLPIAVAQTQCLPQAHTDAVSKIIYVPDTYPDPTVWTGSYDRSVKVWKL